MTAPLASKRRILLVDDEESLAWSLGSRLGKMRPSYEVSIANEGEVALGQLQRAPVDLLIVDVRMPKMSGIELALAARRMTPRLPVIVMTAFKTVDIQRLHGPSSTTFLEKPFEFEHFLECIDQALLDGSGFSGAISVQTLPDVVQIYMLSNTTGMLAVQRGSLLGRIWFERGQVVHASTGDHVAEEAFFQIMRWAGGEFSMGSAAPMPPRSITLDSQNLLMESCRRLDESRRHEGDTPHSERGWTEAPPSFPPDFMAEFDIPISPIPLIHPTENISMNVKESLTKLNGIDGFLGACLVDAESGMILGQDGGGSIDLEVAAAANTEVVRAKRKAMAALNLSDAIEDILITLGKHYHLIRPLRARPSVFYYLVLDRPRSNLAMARIALAEVEKELTF